MFYGAVHNKDNGWKKSSNDDFRAAISRAAYYLRRGGKNFDDSCMKLMQNAMNPFPIIINDEGGFVEVTLIKTDLYRMPEKGDYTVTQRLNKSTGELSLFGESTCQPGIVAEVDFDLEAYREAMAKAEDAEANLDWIQKYDVVGEVTVGDETSSVGVVFDVKELLLERELLPYSRTRTEVKEEKKKTYEEPQRVNLPEWCEEEERDERRRHEKDDDELEWEKKRHPEYGDDYEMEL